MPYGVSSDDAMLMARTMWSENKDATPDEYAAMANVMRNRVQSGNFGGNTMSQVIFSPNQFQGWNDPNAKNYPMKAPLRSPAFQSAYRIASDVMGGNEDLTNGAINFHAASMNPPPKWAKGRQARQIGATKFYGPEPKPDIAPEDQATIDKFYPAQKPQQAAPSTAPVTDEDKARIERFYPTQEAQTAPQAETPAAKVAGGFQQLQGAYREQLPATQTEKPLNEVGPSSETLAKFIGVLGGGAGAFGLAKVLPGLVRTAIPMAAKKTAEGAILGGAGGLAYEVLGPDKGARLMELVHSIRNNVP